MQVLFEDMKGKVFKSINKITEYDTDKLEFVTEDNTIYTMYHPQDCCESVNLIDIIGDLDDLIGNEIIMSEEITNSDTHPEGNKMEVYNENSFTWTFQKMATIKGYVTFRWFGTSNGYYSERVEIHKK